MTNQKQVRMAFWERCTDPKVYPFYRRSKRQNAYPANVRCAFVDFVDQLARSGEISEALASRVTL